jgi:hypothetical protein
MERKLTITLLLLMVIVYVSALTILMYLAPEYSPIENPQHEIKPAYNITIIIDYGN